MINKKTFSYFGEEDAVEVIYSEDTMREVMYKIFDYMETHNCFHGETLHQKDDCIIYAPEVLSEIIDNILKPKFIKEL